MKKKIVILTVLLSLLATGVLSAAAWGKFEGNNIVRLLINGKEAKVQDVPAVMLNNRTMVPIYMLREAGLDVGWNSKTYTVEVKTKSDTNDLEELKKISITLDHYKYLLDYYHKFNDFQTLAVRSYNEDNVLLMVDLTVEYMEMLNTMEDIENQINSYISYAGENSDDIKIIRGIFSNFENNMKFTSAAIDYHNAHINSGDKASYNNFADQISKLSASNEAAKKLIDNRYSILQDKVYQ